MATKINIQIEKTATGYFAYSADLDGQQFQGESLDILVEALKLKLNQTLSEDPSSQPNDRPIWAIAQDITQDMTPEEIANLPKDGASQHDHYIYGTAKRA